MKLVKEWKDGLHKVEISAQFEKDGGSQLDGYTWVYYDAVNIVARVYLDGEVEVPLNTFKAEASSYEHVSKWSLFKKRERRIVSMQESFEECMENLTYKCASYIKKKEYEKEITDGLPDSLKGL